MEGPVNLSQDRTGKSAAVRKRMADKPVLKL
jgi:hypothetical protein